MKLTLTLWLVEEGWVSGINRSESPCAKHATTNWSSFWLNQAIDLRSVLHFTWKFSDRREQVGMSLSKVLCLPFACALFPLIYGLKRVQSFNNYLLLRRQQRNFQRQGAFKLDPAELPFWHRFVQCILIGSSLRLGRLIEFFRRYCPLSSLYSRK